MKNKKRMKKFLMILLIIAFVVVIQTAPVMFPKPIGSKTMVDENIILHYQKGDEKGATEVFQLLQTKSDSIRTQMNFESSKPTKVYLYKTQWQLAIREAGFVTLIIAPPWYIGDSHNGNIMMVSPYTKVSSHDHDSILLATLHELVHSINYQINPDISYFWDNGLATYLSDQKPEYNELFSNPIPTIKDMHTDNGLKFGQMGGYAYSYNYIEYLNDVYGWESIVSYASGSGSYEDIFNHTEEEIYQDWCQYLIESEDNLA